MAYSIELNDRLRIALAGQKKVKEIHMFGGSCFMVNGKMCVGVMKDELMCRIDPERCEEALQKNGSRKMVFTGRPMKGFILVEQEGLKSKKNFDYWLNLSLDFNKKAKASKKNHKK